MIIPFHDPAYENDHLQFARMINELQLLGVFTPNVCEQLNQNMDLDLTQLDDIITRATEAYDEYVETNIQP